VESVPRTDDQPAPGAQDAVLRAVQQFNARQFWECHETLEDFWGEEHGPLRDFYHGFIQVAAAFVHVQRLNWQAAARLLALGAERLEPFQPACMGVDVAALLADVESWRRALQEPGPNRAVQIAARGLPLVRRAPASADSARPQEH
jgi:predicted metal-dependent hydrolase